MPTKRTKKEALLEEEITGLQAVIAERQAALSDAAKDLSEARKAREKAEAALARETRAHCTTRVLYEACLARDNERHARDAEDDNDRRTLRNAIARFYDLFADLRFALDRVRNEKSDAAVDDIGAKLGEARKEALALVSLKVLETRYVMPSWASWAAGQIPMVSLLYAAIKTKTDAAPAPAAPAPAAP